MSGLSNIIGNGCNVPTGVAATVPPAPPAAATVGINLSSVNYFATAVPFVNLFKMAETWLIEPKPPGNVASSVTEAYDSDGYPLEVPFARGGIAQIATKYCGTKVYGGTYVLLFDGDGDFLIYNATITSQTANRYVLNAGQNLTQSIVLQLTRSNVSNPVKNIRLVQAAYENNHATQVFYPDFMNQMAGVGCIRFMDWGGTNGNTNTTWSTRTQTTHVQGRATRGVAYEYMADLCNRIGADAWVCVPAKADDDYCTQMATVFSDLLDPTLKVYVELSNELWNGIFSQAIYAQTQGNAAGLNTVGDFPVPDSGATFWSGIKWQVRRSAQVWKLFSQVLGSSRCVNVASSQAGNAQVTTTIRSSLANVTVNPLAADALAQCNAVAIAPYFGAGVIDAIATAGGPYTTDEIFRRLTPRIVSDTRTMTRNHKTALGASGIRLLAYEIGQHLYPTGGNENIVALATAQIASNADPRMLQFYRDMDTEWKAESGSELKNYFAYVAPTSKFGSWGLLTYQGQPESASTPKYTAFLEAIAA